MQRWRSSEKFIYGSAVAKAYTGYVSYLLDPLAATRGKCKNTHDRVSVLQDSTLISKDAPRHATAQGRAEIYDANSGDRDTVEKIMLFDASKIVNDLIDD